VLTAALLAACSAKSDTSDVSSDPDTVSEDQPVTEAPAEDDQTTEAAPAEEETSNLKPIEEYYTGDTEFDMAKLAEDAGAKFWQGSYEHTPNSDNPDLIQRYYISRFLFEFKDDTNLCIEFCDLRHIDDLDTYCLYACFAGYNWPYADETTFLSILSEPQQEYIVQACDQNPELFFSQWELSREGDTVKVGDWDFDCDIVMTREGIDQLYGAISTASGYKSANDGLNPLEDFLNYKY